MINLVLAEDMHIIRSGIDALFKEEMGVRVIGHAHDGEEILALVEERHHEIDVIVMDLEMPKKNGLLASAAIKLKYPDIGIVILTTHKEKAFLRRALELGIRGYILKDDVYEELIYAIREVAKGEEYYGKELVKLQREIIREKTKPQKILSKREIQVAEKSMEGLTTDEIGQSLHIASHTVHTHLRTIRKKLNVRNKTEMHTAIKQRGLIPPEFPQL